MPKKKSAPAETQTLAPVDLKAQVEAAAAAAQSAVVLPGRPSTPTMADLGVKDGGKVEVGTKVLSIRDLQGFPNAPLSHRMEAVWGVFTKISTITDTQNSKFYVCKGDPDETQHPQVNRGGTQNLVNFSLAVPLTMLKIRPASDRQWNLLAEEIAVADGPPVFMFNVVERESVPRQKGDQQDEAGGQGPTDGGANAGTDVGGATAGGATPGQLAAPGSKADKIAAKGAKIRQQIDKETEAIRAFLEKQFDASPDTEADHDADDEQL